jgi:hypothetical protein
MDGQQTKDRDPSEWINSLHPRPLSMDAEIHLLGHDIKPSAVKTKVFKRQQGTFCLYFSKYRGLLSHIHRSLINLLNIKRTSAVINIPSRIHASSGNIDTTAHPCAVGHLATGVVFLSILP